MRPDKGYRSVRTDVQTDSETIYEAYVRLLNSFHRKVSRSCESVSLRIFARGGELPVDIHILKSLSLKVSRWVVGVSLSILEARRGGVHICI